MALDSFDRTAALNAIVEAWTRKGSLPYITPFNLAASSTKNFHCTSGYCGVLFMFGGGAERCTIIMLYAATAAIVAHALEAANHIVISGSASAFTIQNTMNRAEVCFLLSLGGIIEEV